MRASPICGLFCTSVQPPLLSIRGCLVACWWPALVKPHYLVGPLRSYLSNTPLVVATLPEFCIYYGLYVCIWCLEVCVCLPGLLFILLFEIGSSAQPGWSLPLGLPGKPQGSSSLQTPTAGITDTPPAFNIDVGGSNSGFHACKESKLSTEPSPSQGFVFVHVLCVSI